MLTGLIQHLVYLQVKVAAPVAATPADAVAVMTPVLEEEVPHKVLTR